MKGLVYLKRLLVFLFAYLSKPFIWLSKITILPIFKYFYKLFLITKAWLSKSNIPFKNKLFYPFTSRHVIHVVLIIIALLITTTNISAKETRVEEFGKKSILFSLIQESDNLLIEEEVTTEGASHTVSYLNNDASINAVTSIPSQNNNTTEGATTTVQDGSALMKPVISGSADTGETRTETVDYVVEAGDTVSSIAEKFAVSTNTILWANNLTEKSVIKPGNKLKILPVTGLTHTVTKNETLSKIANLYEADKEKILEFNNIIDESLIKIGETLVIPDGEKPTPVTPPTSYAYNKPQTPTIAPITNIFSNNAPASAPVSATKLQWPTSVTYISQYYSWRHTGLDIAGPIGSPLYAAGAGTVIKAQGGWNGGYGTYVIIDHGGGMQTLYGHASQLFVTVGQQVSRGQTVAAMGSTGRSTGPHIHFEVRIGGKRLNPLSYLK